MLHSLVNKFFNFVNSDFHISDDLKLHIRKYMKNCPDANLYDCMKDQKYTHWNSRIVDTCVILLLKDFQKIGLPDIENIEDINLLSSEFIIFLVDVININNLFENKLYAYTYINRNKANITSCEVSNLHISYNKNFNVIVDIENDDAQEKMIELKNQCLEKLKSQLSMKGFTIND